MKTSYNIYQITFDIWLGFEKPKTETLLGELLESGVVKHVKPECYKFHSGYTYKTNCRPVGRITKIRLKNHEQDQTALRKE